MERKQEELTGDYQHEMLLLSANTIIYAVIMAALATGFWYLMPAMGALYGAAIALSALMFVMFSLIFIVCLFFEAIGWIGCLMFPSPKEEASESKTEIVRPGAMP